MPIDSRSNNRILPSNARAVDPAIKRVNSIIDTQNRRYDSAFQVQGYGGILYHKKTYGTACNCSRALEHALHRLDSNGNLSSSSIDSLVTGGDFGILPRGSRPADNPSYKSALPETLGIKASEYNPGVEPDIIQSLDEPSLLSLSGRYSAFGEVGTAFDRISADPDIPGSTTILPQEINGSGIKTQTLQDYLSNAASVELSGVSDLACPICFGTKYLGGWDTYSGFRIVRSVYEAELSAQDTIDLHSQIPTATISSGILSWKVTLPLGVTGVDCLKIWDASTIVQPLSVMIDGISITNLIALRAFCDGRAHTLTFTVNPNQKLSHMELQFDQSIPGRKIFDLPKTSKASLVSLLDSTGGFQIIFSPSVPSVNIGDVVAENTTGKYLQVSEVTAWHTNSRKILGWEASVRVVQPQEILTRLPNRSTHKTPPTRVPNVTDNMSGGNRT